MIKRQEKEEFDGYIKVEIVREPQEIVQVDGIDSSINDIIGFNAIDNGIGLDENNMRSFLQSDSTYRAEKGGKGVGRFAWLKAFEKTEIESVFKGIDGTYVKRTFDFSLKDKEIDDSLSEISKTMDNCTTVKLVNYYPEYRKNVNKNAETIATKIMQHCMIYLMSAKCPKIVVVDEEKYDINAMFETRVKREENSKEINCIFVLMTGLLWIWIQIKKFLKIKVFTMWAY